ncbi:hypothetical protein SKAU_G00216010 [Synaphobranchus kaupii]|uniref:Uncharacterized protein n=1 Tax=Synaphobranchus kaupii TaxID=118154 RepID=A0A9Q1IV15_SYNKA|nr:hypothetical protein SKAU_G00216010 [Synaphobranchus kaupii]
MHPGGKESQITHRRVGKGRSLKQAAEKKTRLTSLTKITSTMDYRQAQAAAHCFIVKLKRHKIKLLFTAVPHDPTRPTERVIPVLTPQSTALCSIRSAVSLRHSRDAAGRERPRLLRDYCESPVDRRANVFQIADR